MSTLMLPPKDPTVKRLCVRHDELLRKENMTEYRAQDEWLSASLFRGIAKSSVWDSGHWVLQSTFSVKSKKPFINFGLH